MGGGKFSVLGWFTWFSSSILLDFFSSFLAYFCFMATSAIIKSN